MLAQVFLLCWKPSLSLHFNPKRRRALITSEFVLFKDGDGVQFPLTPTTTCPQETRGRRAIFRTRIDFRNDFFRLFSDCVGVILQTVHPEYPAETQLWFPSLSAGYELTVSAHVLSADITSPAFVLETFCPESWITSWEKQLPAPGRRASKATVCHRRLARFVGSNLQIWLVICNTRRLIDYLRHGADHFSPASLRSFLKSPVFNPVWTFGLSSPSCLPYKWH